MRLTKKKFIEEPYTIKQNQLPNYMEVYRKLARYEETGLEPEDINLECEPEYLGENMTIGYRNGKCKCGNIVKSYQKYCDECGTKLNWGNVRA